MSSYFLGLIAILAACLGLQSLGLRLSGGKTLKSESNYFSSIARIQTESRGKPSIMLLGSSMTGRLGDRAQPVAGVANLGCDGGSAVITLRAMDQGILPAAPLLIVEANSLAFELEGRGKEIGAALGSHWFQLGIDYPNLGATARPAAFAYSWLMGRKLAGDGSATPEPLPIGSHPAYVDSPSLPKLDVRSTALVDEVSGILDRLKAKGSEIMIVMLPPGSADSSIPKAIAAQSQVRWWDLTEGLPPGAVSFSDGLHLDAPSAQKVMTALMQTAGEK